MLILTLITEIKPNYIIKLIPMLDEVSTGISGGKAAMNANICGLPVSMFLFDVTAFFKLILFIFFIILLYFSTNVLCSILRL